MSQANSFAFTLKEVIVKPASSVSVWRRCRWSYIFLSKDLWKGSVKKLIIKKFQQTTVHKFTKIVSWLTSIRWRQTFIPYFKAECDVPVTKRKTRHGNHIDEENPSILFHIIYLLIPFYGPHFIKNLAKS